MSVQNKRILGYVRLFIHKNKTEAWQKLPRSFREFLHHCSLKAIVYRIVFLSKQESFIGAAMQRRFHRTCPVCGRPDLKNISTHLLQVHGLSFEERKPYLKQAQVSSWQPHVERSPHMTMSYMNVEKPGQKREKQSEHSPPAKRPRTAARTTSLATKSCPEFNFRHKFSLLIVGPTQSGKTYFVQQILESNRIVYEEQRAFAFFGTTINGKNVMKNWKHRLEKASDLKEVCPNCLKICVKSMPGTITSSF